MSREQKRIVEAEERVRGHLSSKHWSERLTAPVDPEFQESLKREIQPSSMEKENSSDSDSDSDSDKRYFGKKSKPKETMFGEPARPVE